MALATVFGLGAQALAHVNGLRISDVEPLLQLRQTGTPIGLRGLLVGGIIISSLGAVMDVAMSISSALSELKAVNPEMTLGELWKSGRNIGRDMVGTMTNTLILAFLGSGFTLMIYLYSLDLPWRGVDELQLPGLGSGQRRLQRHRRHFGSASDNHHRRPAFIQETMNCSAAKSTSDLAALRMFWS